MSGCTDSPFGAKYCFRPVVMLSVALSLRAQTSGTGRISGRIFNPATQEYVRNAEISVEGTNVVTFSGDDGSYVLSNVPAGKVTVVGRLYRLRSRD